jgi:hypothetical protein
MFRQTYLLSSSFLLFVGGAPLSDELVSISESFVNCRLSAFGSFIQTRLSISAVEGKMDANADIAGTIGSDK